MKIYVLVGLGSALATVGLIVSVAAAYEAFIRHLVREVITQLEETRR